MNLRNRLYKTIKCPHANFEIVLNVWGEDLGDFYEIHIFSQPTMCRPQRAELEVHIFPQRLNDLGQEFVTVWFNFSEPSRGQTVRKAMRLLNRLGVFE